MRSDGEVLSVAGVTGVSLYEPGALTVVAAAGTPLAEIEAVLAAENQRLAFEPPDYRGLLGTTGAPSIGAVAVGNLSGPRRIQGGAARDFLLGVRFVDGTGTVVKNGGRVMKNVTGYDLVKLMSGSWGALGVVTEVAFKVLPRADHEATVVLRGLTDAVAVQALSAALGSPFDVTGAAHVPQADGGAQTLIRIEGFETSVAYRAGALVDQLASFGAADTVTDGSATLWKDIRDVVRFHAAEGDVWRISVKPTDGPGLVSALGALDVVYDWGGGLIWALMPSGTDVRARMADISGHATLVRANADTVQRLGRFQPEPEAVRRLTDGVRARFDPKGILNPGLTRAAVEA